MRLDCAFRVGASTSAMSVNYNSSGAQAVSVTAGWYMSAAALAAQIQTNIQATVDGGMTCSESGGRFTIASDQPYTLTWTHPSLRDWLGWTGDITSTTSSAADSVCPGVFVASQSWGNEAYGWRWSVKRWSGRHQRGQSLKLGKIGVWSIVANMHAGELDQFRSCIGFMLRGIPATWYRNTADATAWTYANWDGKVEVTLDQDAYSDQWLTMPHLRELSVSLSFLEYSAATGSISDWATAIEAPDLGVRYYCKIQGIGDLPLSAEVPIGPTGSAWAAPTSLSVAHTYRPYMLDTSAGLVDSGPEISRRTSEVSTGGMDVSLLDDRAGTLYALMAREKATGNAANLEASFAYTATTMTVDATAGFASAGLLYFGRECIKHTGKSGTTFTGLTRGVFGLLSGSDPYDNAEYVHNADKPHGARVVSDYPRAWHGRWLSVYQHVVDVFGRALDSAIDGSYSREIFRGTIKGSPTSQDWLRWSLRCDSIDAITHTEVGREPIQGMLMRIPGSWQMNIDGGTANDPFSTIEPTVFYLSENTRYIDIEVKEYADLSDFEAGVISNSHAYVGETGRIAIDDAGTIHSHSSLKAKFASAMNTALQSQGFNDPADVATALVINIQPLPSGSSVVAWYVQWYGSAYHRIDILWTAPGSIGKLLGFDVDCHMTSTGSAAPIPGATGTGKRRAAYIGPTDTVIPFFLMDSTGLQKESLPASGFAKIGGDDGEIVKFASITNINTTLKGLYQLNVSQRGALGTQAIEHEIVIDWKTWASTSELVTIDFGIGFDDVGPITALLRLACSTAIAGHHGAYDTLGRGVSPPLNPLHFNTAEMAAIEAKLIGAQKTIKFYMSESTKLSELASKLLAPFGMHLLARHNADGDYLITVGELLPALESEASETIGTSELSFEGPAKVTDGSTQIVNQLIVYPIYDAAAEETNTDSKVAVVDADSVAEFGEKGKLSWKIIGYQLSPAVSLPIIYGWAQQIFARFGRPYDILRLRMDRLGWGLKPGDHILLTLPKIATPTGARGYSSDIATVLQCRYIYEPSAPGSEIGTEVTVVVEPYVRTSTYSPSAKIASYASGTPSVTLVANAFTAAGVSTDVAHFDDGDVVRIFNEGDMGTVSVVTLSGKSSNTFTISGTLAGGLGAGSYMVAENYGAVQATQRKHAFIASTATPPVLSTGNTEAFKYV